MAESYAVDVDSRLFDGGSGPPQSRVNGLVIRFDTHLVENALESWGGVAIGKDGLPQKVEGKGRPVYDEVEYIEIMVPGDRNNIVHRPVTNEDRRKFAQQYAQWKAGSQETASGTPLKAWPGITRAQVEELAYFNVKTVEQLAAISDGNLQSIPFARGLQNRAKAYLEQAKGNAPLEAALAEIERLKNHVAALTSLPSTPAIEMDEAPKAPKRVRKVVAE